MQLRHHILERRVTLLRASMSHGLGEKVSQIYVSLSEDYEHNMKFKEASEILLTGIEKNAEPKEILEEALR